MVESEALLVAIGLRAQLGHLGGVLLRNHAPVPEYVALRKPGQLSEDALSHDVP
jgi:hypothetical protein